MMEYSVANFRAEHKKAVKRGVRLLDKARPGWENEIDLTTLVLSNINCCVLGQLYSCYTHGKKQLSNMLEQLRVKFSIEGGEIDAEHYGFEALCWNAYNAACPRQLGYSVLTEEWTAVIERRRKREVAAERKRRKNS